tara:strand:- start:1353 stop:1733 length:381 start_codon:yes stop_codon:yes gene_type:complete
MEILNLTKKAYARNQYARVINTNFSQLAITQPTQTPVDLATAAAAAASTLTVSDFFQNYSQLFFQIPKEGETNSHEYLIKRSSEYTNFSATNDDIQALIDEINILQQQNLELNQQIVELQPTGSQA